MRPEHNSDIHGDREQANRMNDRNTRCPPAVGTPAPMNCPHCGEPAVFLHSAVRNKKTVIRTKCSKCRRRLPLSSEKICPILEAFVELLPEGTMEYPTEMLQMCSDCETGQFDRCPRFQKENCPRRWFTETLIKNLPVDLSLYGSTVRFKREPAKKSADSYSE